LPRKHEALSSNASTTKTKQKPIQYTVLWSTWNLFKRDILLVLTGYSYNFLKEVSDRANPHL
jgi:hypothetical protein